MRVKSDANFNIFIRTIFGSSPNLEMDLNFLPEPWVTLIAWLSIPN